MKTKSAIGLIAGLCIIALLVSWQGAQTVMGLLAQAGLLMLLICFFDPLNQLLGAEAWRCLFPASKRPGALDTFLASLMGSAVNTLLPLASIGGEIIKARILVLRSCPGIDAVSTMVVDKTAQAISVLLWGITGIIMLAAVADNPAIIWSAIGGAILLALGIGGFVAIQISGSFSFLARFGSRAVNLSKWRGMVGGAIEFDEAIRAIYQRPGAMLLSISLRLLQRVWLIGEVIFAARLMGQGISLTEALLLKCLVGALRGVSFAIPAGIGVQEGAYVFIGSLIGLPGDLMLAVSLATRIREIVPAFPLFFYWQYVESRHLWSARRAVMPANTDPDA